MVVSVKIKDSLAFIEIDNPPVNATSHAVRTGLLDALSQTESNATVVGVVLTCTGRTFVAGADIREFDAPPREPHLPDVLRSIERASKPWVAALHGTVLGGGLELAMACHARIAHSGTKLGLPEVTLGLIPGAGGTVRLPRLVDPTVALTMIAGGKPISAETALSAGLIDEISDDLIEAAAQHARRTKAMPTLDRSTNRPNLETFENTKQNLLGKARGQLSIPAAVAAVERALNLPPETALEAERKTFLDLKKSKQSAALRHIFFAERGTLSDPRCKGPTRPIESVGIVGGGTMGAGIAAACLLAGYKVSLVERDDAAVKAARKRIEGILAQSLKRGIITESGHAKLLTSFQAADTYDTLSKSDLAIEAVFEDLDVKREVFKTLHRVTEPEAILATNTSYLDVNRIAETVADPSRVIGLHFFSPAHIMKLLEIVVPENVSDDVIATSAKFAKRLGKIGVLSGVCDGFIGNRIMSAYRHEADILLEEGALPWEIDAAMRNFGFPMGIYEMQDLAGLDIAWAMRKRRAAEQPKDETYVAIVDRLCEQGWFGRKTGQGWYVYEDGQAKPSAETTDIIEAERTRKGRKPANLPKDAIMDRILDRMQQEAHKVVAEGIARRPEDVDVVMVNGYGYPRWRGGPLFGGK